MEERFGPEGEEGWPRFAIVDDKVVVPDGHPWRERFVQTSPAEGLTDSHVERLLVALEVEVEGSGIRPSALHKTLSVWPRGRRWLSRREVRYQVIAVHIISI